MGFRSIDRQQKGGTFSGWVLPTVLLLGVMGSPANSSANAAQTLTEQLHTPPMESRRQQRDVADEFLLMGQYQLSVGDHESAIISLHEAANAYHYLGDFAGMGEAYSQLVRVYSSLGQYDDAEEVVRQQLAIARSETNFSNQVMALNNLGTIRLQVGDLDTAHAAFLEGLTISEDIASNRGIGLSLSNLGLIAAAQGQINDAQEVLRGRGQLSRPRSRLCRAI